MRIDGYLLFLFLFLFLFTNCKNGKKNTDSQISSNNNPVKDTCFETQEKERVLKAIMETEDFQIFLHPDIEGRLPVKVVKNDFITDNLSIIVNGHKVVFRDSLALPYGDVHRIDISDVDCTNKKLTYSIFYPIEGAAIRGKAHKSGNIWITTVTHVGELDKSPS